MGDLPAESPAYTSAIFPPWCRVFPGSDWPTLDDIWVSSESGEVYIDSAMIIRCLFNER